MKKFYSSLAMMAVLPALASCGDDGIPGVGGVTDACELKCKGVVEASGSVSGIAKVDAFFTSALKFRAQATALQADVTGTLGEMAGALGLSTEGSAADIAAKIETHIKGGFGGKIDGGITIDFKEPRCEVSAQATLQAAARCDAKVDPGKASVECNGGCVIDAEAKASCEGEVKCTGSLPSAKCEGTCEGSCELEAGAKCEGTCSGTCELDGSAACDGECQGSTDEGGNCTGECKLNAGAKCEGECKGSCELSAGATCNGTCKGECTFTPGNASCDGELTCEAKGSVMAECKGECKGEVIPPKVEAECEASVKAEASFEAECSPPSLDVSYKLDAEWSADASADAKLEFEAQLQAFVKAFGKLQAKGAKLKLVTSAGADLVASADGAVKGVVTNLSGSGDLKVKMGAVCAVQALPGAKTMLTGAFNSVKASADAVVKVTGAVGG